MVSEIDFTFKVSPREKSRYNAGPYDAKTQSPRYTLEISIPEHVKHLVVIQQFLMGGENNRIWVWDIESKSSWPAFIIVRRDGELMR